MEMDFHCLITIDFDLADPRDGMAKREYVENVVKVAIQKAFPKKDTSVRAVDMSNYFENPSAYKPGIAKEQSLPDKIRTYYKQGEGYGLYMPDGTPLPCLKGVTVRDEWVDVYSKAGNALVHDGSTAIVEMSVVIVNEEPVKIT